MQREPLVPSPFRRHVSADFGRPQHLFAMPGAAVGLRAIWLEVGEVARHRPAIGRRRRLLLLAQLALWVTSRSYQIKSAAPRCSIYPKSLATPIVPDEADSAQFQWAGRVHQQFRRISTHPSHAEQARHETHPRLVAAPYECVVPFPADRARLQVDVRMTRRTALGLFGW